MESAIKTLRDMGYTLTLDGETVRVSPRPLVTDIAAAFIKENKAEIVRSLKNET